MASQPTLSAPFKTIQVPVEASAKKPSLSTLLAPIIGNFLEWYDFAVYAFVASLVAKNFFPATDAATGLLSSFAVFGVGFLARPLGSIVIGRLADTRGRRAALLLTVYIMTGGTFLLAVLPTYAMAGVFGPILLILARLLQGFSAGGEWGGAITYLVEWAPERRRGLYGSLHLLGLVCGFLMGSGTVALLNSILTPQDMTDWGWRLPFAFGCVIGPFALWLRRAASETPAFERIAASDERPLPMLKDGRGFKLAMKASGMSILAVISFYVLLLYMPTWVTTHLKLPASDALWANTVGLVIVAILTPVFGLISDFVGRKKVLLVASVSALTIAYPAFSYLMSLSPATLKDVIVIQCIFSTIVAAIVGVHPTALVEMFSTNNRTTWMSIGYGASVMIFGGFAPFISIWLIQHFGTPIAPAYYLMAGALVSGLVILFIRETAFGNLR